MKEQYRQLGDVLRRQPIVNPKITRHYTKSKMSMFWFDWVLYALVLAAIGVLIYMLITSPESFWLAFLVAFLIVSMTRLFGMTPREVELTQEGVVIRLWMGHKTFPYADIELVERFAYHGHNIRLFGTSGTKLRVGWFWNSGIGIYQSYVADKYNSILLRTRSGKKYLFSAANADEFLSAIRDNLSTTNDN